VSGRFAYLGSKSIHFEFDKLAEMVLALAVAEVEVLQWELLAYYNFDILHIVCKSVLRLELEHKSVVVVEMY